MPIRSSAETPALGRQQEDATPIVENCIAAAADPWYASGRHFMTS